MSRYLQRAGTFPKGVSRGVVGIGVEGLRLEWNGGAGGVNVEKVGRELGYGVGLGMIRLAVSGLRGRVSRRCMGEEYGWVGWSRARARQGKVEVLGNWDGIVVVRSRGMEGGMVEKWRGWGRVVD